jgi:hypothetical protein
VAEKEQVLAEYCEKNGSPIELLRSGEDKEEDLKLSDDWLNLEKEWREVLQEILKQAELFLRSPIFTDSFHKNHSNRRDWESDYIDNDIEAEISDYYKTNRFNISRLGLPFNFKSMFGLIEHDDNLSDDVKNKSRVIIEKLKLDFPDNLQEYSNISDEKKLEIVEKIEPIFKEIVNLLSDK